MQVRCRACSHIFLTWEAKCEDWAIKGKGFICPKCNAKLVNPYAKKLTWKRFLKLLPVILGVCLLLRLMTLVSDHFGNHPLYWLIDALVVIALLWWVYKHPFIPVAETIADSDTAKLKVPPQQRN